MTIRLTLCKRDAINFKVHYDDSSTEECLGRMVEIDITHVTMQASQAKNISCGRMFRTWSAVCMQCTERDSLHHIRLTILSVSDACIVTNSAAQHAYK